MRQVSQTTPRAMTTKPRTNTGRLTRRETEIVNALFALGNRASAEDIRARLSSPPGDSAVRVMLTRLEKKGYLKHQQDGLRYIYSATISTAAAKRTALRSYLQTFFGGSLKQMMTALVSEAAWTDDELGSTPQNANWSTNGPRRSECPGPAVSMFAESRSTSARRCRR